MVLGWVAVSYEHGAPVEVRQAPALGVGGVCQAPALGVAGVRGCGKGHRS